jgi:ABC-2 type transport system ATP-binding protein
MLQRIGLAQSLIGDPELVFLDEPTSGLDPLGRRLVRDIMHRLNEQGTTVFLNSHLLSEVEVTCTRVAFIANGRVRHITSLDDYADGLLEVDLRVGHIDEGLVPGLQQWSEQIDVDAATRRLTLRLPSESALPDIARWLVERGTELYKLSPRTVSLEDLFVRIVESQHSTEEA